MPIRSKSGLIRIVAWQCPLCGIYSDDFQEMEIHLKECSTVKYF